MLDGWTNIVAGFFQGFWSQEGLMCNHLMGLYHLAIICRDHWLIGLFVGHVFSGLDDFSCRKSRRSRHFEMGQLNFCFTTEMSLQSLGNLHPAP